jgi:hypothetical protein
MRGQWTLALEGMAEPEFKDALPDPDAVLAAGVAPVVAPLDAIPVGVVPAGDVPAGVVPVGVVPAGDVPAAGVTAANAAGGCGGDRLLSSGAANSWNLCKSSARSGSAPGNCTVCGFRCTPLVRYS